MTLAVRYGLRVSCCACLLFVASSVQARNALVFDGLNDYVDVSDADELDFGSGDFTISAWIKTGDAPVGADFPMIINKEPGSGTRTGYELFIPPDVGSDRKVRFQIVANSVFASVTSTTSINDGQWHHVAGIKTATQIEIVVDGVSEGTTPHALGDLSNELSLSFGRSGFNNSWFFSGAIGEVRIWSIARTPAEIMGDMNQLLGGDEPGLSGYWPIEREVGQIADELVNNNEGRLGSAPGVDQNDPMRILGVFPHDLADDNSAWFDGANDLVLVPSAPELNFDSNDFSVSCWVKFRQFPVVSNYPIIVSKEQISGPRNGFSIFVLPSPIAISGKVSFQIYSNNAGFGTQSRLAINDGRWHHIAGVKTSETLKLYVDGKLNDTVAHVAGTISNNANLQFGAYPSPIQWFFNGLIDEVRLWNTARTQSEILDEYLRRLPGDEPDLVGYWRLNDGQGQSVIDEVGINNGQLGTAGTPDVSDSVWFSEGFPAILGRDGFESQPPDKSPD